MNKFTLIELLVVVAIIGILSSMLLPSIKDAREKGIATVCISNMKQSTLQGMFYQNDNNNYHYMKKSSENSDGWFGWSGRLYELNYFASDERSLFCPKSAPGSGAEELNEWRFKQNSYAGNTFGLYKNTLWADRSWLIKNGTDYYSNYITVPKTSEFVFLADSYSTSAMQNEGIYRNASTYTNGNWGKIWTPHNPVKKANAAFVDGHIASTSVADLRSLMEPSLVFAYE